MKKLILTICLVLGMTACGEKKEATQETGKPVVKIGVTLPLSGDMSNVGEGVKNALQMLSEKWQAKDTKYQYDFIVENDLLKPQQAAINAQKFVNIDKVNVIVSVFGVVDRPVDEIANQNKVISLSCSYGKSSVPEYGINTGTQNEEIYAKTLEQLKKRNVKTVALIGSPIAVSEAILGYFEKQLPKDNIQVIANERFSLGETDYRLSIQKIERLKPDYYLVFGFGAMNGIFPKQYHELTGKKNIASLGTFCGIDPKYFPPLNGVWSPYLLGASDDFEKEYDARFHHRVESCSASLYDGMDMIITAFENTPVQEGKILPDNLDVLKNVKKFKSWNGAFGRTTIQENGIVRSEAKVRVYQDGKWVRVEE